MYKIGQTFENIYPTDVADWCNSNNCHIEQIESVDDIRIFKIKENVVSEPYVETEADRLQRIANSKLTGTDVERAILKVKGMDFDDILEFVTQNKPEGIDIKSLKVELKANHFYRGNPYVNAVGTFLGFTSEQLDKFFETNDYTVLLPQAEPDVEEINND